MEISYSVTVPVSTELITLSEAKLWARVDFSDEDTIITELITDARVYAEKITKRAIGTQTIQAIIQPPLIPETFSGPIAGPLDQWVAAERPNIPLFGNMAMRLKLPMPPLQTFNTVEYQLTRMDNPEWQTLNALDSNGNNTYRIDTYADPQEVNIFEILAASRYRLTYVTGYTTSTLPGALKAAMKRLIAFLYDNRSGEAIPDSINQELARFRVMDF